MYEHDNDGAKRRPKDASWCVLPHELQEFRLKLIPIGVSEDDLLSVMRHDRNDLGGLGLSLRPFSWRKIKQWNDFKAHRSIISVEGVKEYNYGY